MSLIFTVKITNNDTGDLTDADATPILSDPTNAFGIQRTDTSATVVVAGTAFTHVSTGVYQYALTGEVAGVTYVAWPKYSVGGTQINNAETKTAALGSVSWYYSDETRFEAFNGLISTTDETDLDSTGTFSAATLLTAGLNADNYIDRGLIRVKSQLARKGIIVNWTIPLLLIDPRISKMMENVSNRLTRRELADARNYGLYLGQSRSLTTADEAAIGLSDKKYGDNWLTDIFNDPSILNTDGTLVSEANAAGHFQSVPIRSGPPHGYRWGVFGGRHL